MLFRRILIKFRSIVKLINYKLLFGKNIEVKNINSIRLDKGSKFIIEDKKSNILINDNVTCREYVLFRINGGKLKIGKNVFFNNFTSINCLDRITIGDDCLFGENVKIYDHDHMFNKKILIREQGFSSKPINIGSNVWIGSNCTILKGVTIGSNVVVGAGSVIREDIPSDTIIFRSDNVIKNKIEFK